MTVVHVALTLSDGTIQSRQFDIGEREMRTIEMNLGGSEKQTLLKLPIAIGALPLSDWIYESELDNAS